jgi:hypothetical protein
MRNVNLEISNEHASIDNKIEIKFAKGIKE